MEKKKLKIETLAITSFVTTLNKDESGTINGEAADSLGGMICIVSLDVWCPVITPIRIRMSPTTVLVSRDGAPLCTPLSIDGNNGCPTDECPSHRCTSEVVQCSRAGAPCV